MACFLPGARGLRGEVLGALRIGVLHGGGPDALGGGRLGHSDGGESLRGT
jgi:hypothetical protein